MKPLFENLPNYKKALKGLNLFNGAIANNNRIYLIGRIHKENTKDSKIKKRVLIFQRDKPIDKQLEVIKKLSGYTDIRCEMSCFPKEQFILYDVGGNQCSITETEYKEESPNGFAFLKSSLINNRQYVTSGKRSVFYRDNNGAYKELGTGQAYQNYENYDRPLKKDGKPNIIALITEDGFHDLDGFNENHIYAVGGKGDVWRYIDGDWIKCGFPTNLRLKNVCCGKDDLVYISGLEGMTYVGKEDSWKALENPELSIPFEDVAWYDGKVWATNDYGTWWITPEGIERAELPDAVMICSGSLHVNAGMLLLVGIGGASLLENGQWQVLSSSPLEYK